MVVGVVVLVELVPASKPALLKGACDLLAFFAALILCCLFYFIPAAFTRSIIVKLRALPSTYVAAHFASINLLAAAPGLLKARELSEGSFEANVVMNCYNQSWAG